MRVLMRFFVPSGRRTGISPDVCQCWPILTGSAGSGIAISPNPKFTCVGVPSRLRILPAGEILTVAIGVFTSFTLSQSGMAKHHLTHREPGWRTGFAINAIGAFLSLVVDIVIAITKFTHGAWLVYVIMPVLFLLMLGVNR